MGKAKAPPRKVEPLPRGKVQERKKENRSAALGDAVRFLSFAEPVGWAFPACSRNEVRREACPFSAEYRGKEKPAQGCTQRVRLLQFLGWQAFGTSPKLKSRLARVQLRTPRNYAAARACQLFFRCLPLFSRRWRRLGWQLLRHGDHDGDKNHKRAKKQCADDDAKEKHKQDGE
jgi:hypothetical protein